MTALVKIIASSVLILQMCGCATSPVAVQPAVPSGETVSVTGFVKAPGRYPFHEGLTVGEALNGAGGRGKCKSCQKTQDERGSHPTFDMPPEIQRRGETFLVSKTEGGWERFILEPGDEIRFIHIMW